MGREQGTRGTALKHTIFHFKFMHSSADQLVLFSIQTQECRVKETRSTSSAQQKRSNFRQDSSLHNQQQTPAWNKVTEEYTENINTYTKYKVRTYYNETKHKENLTLL